MRYVRYVRQLSLRSILTLAVLLACGGEGLTAAPPATPSKRRTDLLRVSFIDVGQGDAIWIQGPARHDEKDGINVLIDGGPVAGDSDETLLDYLSAYGFKEGSVVDCMILTHPHDDHSGGLVDVLEKYDVKLIIDAGYPKAEKSASGRISPYGIFMRAARAETGAKYVKLRDHPEGKYSLAWGDDSAPDGVPAIEAKVLSGYWASAQEFGSKTNTIENNASTVVRMTFGDISFLFMGDAEGKERKDKPDKSRYVEKLLVDRYRSNPGELRSTVLKVGHHGSETSSTHEFMDAVSPDVLVVMSGRKKFGTVYLPDDSVLDRYHARLPGITIVRTDQDDEDEDRDTTNDADGDHVYMYTDGETLRVYEAKRLSGKWRWVLRKKIQPDTDDDPS